jgi:DNA-binding NarL/FixJ family response regulator
MSDSTNDGMGTGTGTGADRSIRVLLVDDQELLRAGFRIILGAQPGIEVVGEAGSGAEAIEAAASLSPDVICMDVQMPGMNGLDATRAITGDPSIAAAVLILTTFDRDDYLFEALAAGASGFLLKNSSPEKLIEAVRVVAGGEALLSPTVTKRVIARFGATAGRMPQPPSPVTANLSAGPGADRRRTVADHADPTGHAGPNDSERAAYALLTERERDVFALLADGLSNQEIAATLYVGEATVKTHVSSIFAKLGVRDRIQAIVWAFRSGYAVSGA